MFHVKQNRAQQLIHQRQIRDDKYNSLQTKLKQEFHQKQFAKWQNKNQVINETQQLHNRLAQMRANAEQKLIQRRKKLLKILETQHEQYETQIRNSQETTQQIQKRMIKELTQYKKNKQIQQQDFVEKKLKDRFERNADQLRKVDQQFGELRAAAERNIQMMEKQDLAQQHYEEQMIFAEQNQRTIRQKEAEEEKKQLQQKEKVQELNSIIEIQQQLAKRKNEKEKMLKKMENQMLRAEWYNQNENQKIKNQQKINKIKEQIQTIKQDNDKILIKQQQQRLKQKQNDKRFIQRILEKEKMLAQEQRRVKVKQREQIKATLGGFKEKKRQMEAYERELDQLIEVQRIKKNRKEQQQWQKRQKARISLLNDVYLGRQNKMRQNKGLLQLQNKKKIQEKQQVKINLQQFHQQQEKKKKQLQEKNKKEQQQLLREIAQKQERRRNILLQLQKQDDQRKKKQIQYDNQIKERKRQGQVKLEQFKKNNQFH